MIVIDHQPSRVSVSVFGEFTLADYKEFEDVVRYRLKFEEKVNLLLDLRDMVDFTLDVAWEEIKFSREHAHDFEKIAVVTDDQWLTWSAWLSRMFVDAEIGVFGGYDEAGNWVAGA